MPSFIRALRVSIRAKVLLLALGLALPPLVVVGALGLSSLNTARDTTQSIVTDALRREAEVTLAKRAADKARLYNATMEDIQRQVEGLATNVTSLMTSSNPPSNYSGRVWVSPDGPTEANLKENANAVARARQFTPILSTVVQRNKLINLGYVALEDGGVMAFDKDIIDTLMAVKPFEAHTRPWYVAASATGHTVWVDTYIDANSKKLTTTCATPFYDARDRLLGVVGFDLLLDTIQQDLLRLDLGRSGYAFLINEQGKVLVGPDLRADGLSWKEPFRAENLLETADPKLRAAVERMTLRQQGVEQLMMDGENVYLAYAPIQTAGWSVGMVIPEQDILRPAQDVESAIANGQQRLISEVGIVFAASLLAVLTLGAVFATLLTRPIRQLQTGAHRVAAGDLRHRLPEASNDEIGDLVLSFNAMTNALNQKLAELEENLRQLATLNSVSNRFKAIHSLPQIYAAIPHAICEDFGFERAALYVLDGDALHVVGASFGPDAEEQAAEFVAAANENPITLDSETVEADIIRSGQAVIVDNPWNHPRVAQGKQQVSRSDSYVQVPIFGHEEKIIGLLSADYHYSRRGVNARDAAQLLTYASMVGLTIENIRLYTELERQVAQRTTELRAALARAQEADRLKGQFLAAISHELRTPLNAIIGFSTVMLDELDGPISAMQREDLKTINQNGRFLLHLINELLDLARIEAGKLDLDIQPVELPKLIGEVVDTVGGLLRQKPVTLRGVVPPNLPRARADVAKVRQILLNLLSNAVKFTDEGTITVTARVVVLAGEAAKGPDAAGDHAGAATLIARDGRPITPYIAISVRDTGMGIAPENLPLIFEEFRQIQAQRGEKQGSGLGLSLARKLIEAHGGRIWVESVPGKGSTFTFTLPCVLAPRAAIPQAPIQPDPATEPNHAAPIGADPFLAEPPRVPEDGFEEDIDVDEPWDELRPAVAASSIGRVGGWRRMRPLPNKS
jgi:two-component system, sensor histidine kinase and response regulator